MTLKTKTKYHFNETEEKRNKKKIIIQNMGCMPELLTNYTDTTETEKVVETVSGQGREWGLWMWRDQARGGEKLLFMTCP